MTILLARNFASKATEKSMSISFVIVALGALPISILISQGLVWLMNEVLELGLDCGDKCLFVGAITVAECVVTLIVLCAAYGKP